MICDSCHTVIVATIGSQCSFSSQLHWTATNVHIKCPCCHLDSIFMWHIESDHTACCHSAHRTVWQIGCIIWQPNLHINCVRCHTYALHVASFWLTTSCLLPFYCQYNVANSLYYRRTLFFCFFHKDFVLSEHTVAIFQVLD